MRELAACISILAAPVIAGLAVVAGLAAGLDHPATFLASMLLGGTLSGPVGRRLGAAIVLADPAWDAARDRPARRPRPDRR